MAIQDALLDFSTEYTLERFLEDLTKIRERTFKENTILHAFERSGIRPVNSNRCVEQLRISVLGDTETATNEPALPTQPNLPRE